MSNQNPDFVLGIVQQHQSATRQATGGGRRQSRKKKSDSGNAPDSSSSPPSDPIRDNYPMHYFRFIIACGVAMFVLDLIISANAFDATATMFIGFGILEFVMSQTYQLGLRFLGITAAPAVECPIEKSLVGHMQGPSWRWLERLLQGSVVATAATGMIFGRQYAHFVAVVLGGLVALRTCNYLLHWLLPISPPPNWRN